jgi:hypothetical protein
MKVVKKFFRLLPLPIIIFFSFSCLSVDRKIINPEKKYSKTNPKMITISFSSPEKQHVILGELSVRFNSGYKRETALGLLTKTASEYGADGIILKPIRRINERFAVSNSSSESVDSSVHLQSYELGGIMYRYLSE